MKGECKLKNFRKTLALISLVLILAIVFTGCTNKESGSKEAKTQLKSPIKIEDDNSQLSGTINIVGSTSVTPVTESFGRGIFKT